MALAGMSGGPDVANDIGVRVVVVSVVAAMAASCAPSPQKGATLGDARQGAQIVERQACGSCHAIPGKAGGFGVVGPPLKGVADRTIIAGFLPNTPPQMIRWLKNPQAVLPRSIMPDMGLTDRQAADVAAYLYTLK